MCVSCFVELKQETANNTADREGWLPEISVEIEGVCKQEDGSQFWLLLCVGKDIL
jgi:hypothetical protein